MRVNTPVSQQERQYKDGVEIISTTNLKGLLETANEDFVELSGFEWSELENKNHNIIRHPDMPAEAFSMLWENLKSGKPWMGIVKNRCKNGDHYWVDAFVTPQYEDGEVVGYQSVRVKPKAEWVTRAGKLYGDIMSGKSTEDIRKSTLSKVKLSRFPISFVNKVILVSIGILSLVLVSLFVSGNLSFMLTIAGITLGGIASYVILGRFLSGLSELSSECKKVYSDALAQYIYTGRTDELGAIRFAMDYRAAALRTSLGMTKSSSSVISKAAEEIASGNLDLSRRTELQASSLEETASSMEQMTSSVQQNADGVQQASEVALETRELAEKSKKVVVDAVQAMDEINESSLKVVDIIQVIDEIAFQTNLLALNAAVEAARAGEQGRGFAVVAGEVRSLAGRSADAAKEIAELIKGSAEKIRNGTKLVSNSGSTLEEIADSVTKVSTIMSEISSASAEQSNGIVQVNSAVTKLDQTNQENAAMVEQITSVSSDMLEKVRTLNKFVNSVAA